LDYFVRCRFEDFSGILCPHFVQPLSVIPSLKRFGVAGGNGVCDDGSVIRVFGDETKFGTQSQVSSDGVVADQHTVARTKS
jgi:hypothetical protein